MFLRRYFLHSSLKNRLSKLPKMIIKRERCILLTERAKSRIKDLKPEILIWKMTIVQMHRESSMRR